MLSRILRVPQSFRQIFKPYTMPSSASTSPSRVVKRQKLEHTDKEEPVTATAPTTENGQAEAEKGMTEEEMVEREMGLPIEHVKKYKHELDYRNKLVLAPMVRTGSCKFRCPRRVIVKS